MKLKNVLKSQNGQSLLELITVISVAVIVVGALTFATISSLRNANFAKSQSQGTKLTQEGIERVRSIRDRDGGVNFTHSQGTTTKFSDLWTVNMSSSCTPCYFILDATGTNLTGVTSVTFENNISGSFTRQVQISDRSASYQLEKMITVVVRWSDFSGPHESKLTTVLRKL